MNDSGLMYDWSGVNIHHDVYISATKYVYRLMKPHVSCFMLICCTFPALAVADTLDVRSFGAHGDGHHIDSPAINRALEVAATHPGDTVVVPEGIYLCYSLHLQSEVTLMIAPTAVIRAAVPTDSFTFDAAEPNASGYQDFGHSHWHNSLLWGEHLHGVRVVGGGIVDGTDVLSRGNGRLNGRAVADKALALRECTDVVVDGVRFLNCGHFALLLTGVDDLCLQNLIIDSNRDGIDIDCCERVTVRNCRVNTLNDDAIVLKASYALGRVKPTADVLIEDCHVSGYDVGSLFAGTLTANTTQAPDRDGPTGRIKIGTESNGDFRNIIIRRCRLTHSRGLAVETVDGGRIENLQVMDIDMSDVCNAPFYVRIGDRQRGPEGLPASSVHGVSFARIRVKDADSRYASMILGLDGHRVTGVTFDDVTIQYRGGITLDDVAMQRGSNPFFTRQPDYPEPAAHGIQPAAWFVVRHADGIQFCNVHVETLQADERPRFLFDDADAVRFHDVTGVSDTTIPTTSEYTIP